MFRIVCYPMILSMLVNSGCFQDSSLNSSSNNILYSYSDCFELDSLIKLEVEKMFEMSSGELPSDDLVMEYFFDTSVFNHLKNDTSLINFRIFFSKSNSVINQTISYGLSPTSFRFDYNAQIVPHFFNEKFTHGPFVNLGNYELFKSGDKFKGFFLQQNNFFNKKNDFLLSYMIFYKKDVDKHSLIIE